MACAVIAMADAKAKEEVVEKVGSASTWGWRERERFKINVCKEDLDPKQLLGEAPWFDFTTLSQVQHKSIIVNLFSYLIPGYKHRRETLEQGTKEEFLQGQLPEHLVDELTWHTFRGRLRQIYRKEAIGARAVQRKKNKVGGRKEAKSERNVQPETPRQVSKGSMLSYDEDSAGGGMLSCAKEVPTNEMASALLDNVIGIWGETAPLIFAPPYRDMKLSWQRY